MSIFSRTLAPIGLGLVVSLAAGCSYSQDQDTFASPPQLPKTITIIDTIQNKPLWTMQIPVGDQLVIDYNGHHLSEMFVQPTTPATHGTWALYKIGDNPDNPFAEPLKQGTITFDGDPIEARITFRKPESVAQAKAEQMPAAPAATQPAQGGGQ